ncbi:MAG: DUF411 domain-containing protein [Gemmatimonadaceae bacterium]
MNRKARLTARFCYVLAWSVVVGIVAGCAERGDASAGKDTLSAPAVASGDTFAMTVYKSPTCGCCTKWVEHLGKNGFRVTAIDREDMESIKKQHGVGDIVASCHTAIVEGYVVEGHVPAADVYRLLRERPAIAGLAVPGMPMGSPGMEGSRTDKYDVIAFDRDGATRVFASH